MHGESEQNAVLDLTEDLEGLLEKQKLIRDADICLTEKGILQAQQTGKYLSETEQFDICLSSSYKRALQTAQEIISNLGYELKLYEDDRLREKEFGRLHGFNAKEVKEKYPDEFFIRERDGKYYYRPLGGENYLDVKERVHGFLDKLVRDYSGKNVLVVTHQVPYKLFRALFEHLSEKGLLDLEAVHNCGMQEYLIDTSEVPEGRMKLNFFNKINYEN